MENSIKTVIKPSMINLKAGGWDALPNTFQTLEGQAIAARVINVSQQVGIWVGLFIEDRYPKNSIADGLIVETETPGGWMYELTDVSIVSIYSAQAEWVKRYLDQILEREREASRKHGYSFWQRWFGIPV